MIRISPTSVPKRITPALTKACQQLAEPEKLIFVDVKTTDYSRPNKCPFNVKETVRQEGGEIVYGWSISIWPNVMLDCIGHAVHLIDDCWKCVTPETNDNAQILFLPDPSIGFNFEDPQARMPSRYIPLTTDPLVRRLIEIESRQIELKRKYPVNSGNIAMTGMDAVEFKRMQPGKIELMRRIFLRFKHHNDPCVCGSGRKFRKCCRSEMLTVGPA